MGWRFDEAFRAECHGVGVDGRIVGEPPVLLSVTRYVRNFHEHNAYQML